MRAPDLGDHVLRLHEHLAVGGVEAPRDLARELDVLALVVAHRHLVGLVEQDVGRLEHRVEEQAGAHELLLARRLVLELVHALEVAVGRDRRRAASRAPSAPRTSDWRNRMQRSGSSPAAISIAVVSST